MRKAFILGAGSSYGHGVECKIRPPLGSEFFTHELAETLKVKYESLFNLITNQMKLDIKNDTVDIESFISRVESLSYLLPNTSPEETIKYTGSIDFYWVPPINTMISYIIDLISLSLSWVKEQTCPYHDFLVKEFLSKGDSIINFNYDLIIEASLRKTRNWSVANGYGFISSENKIASCEDILLLKPHGSLNWKTYETKYTTSLDSYILNSGVQETFSEKIQILGIENFLNSNYLHFAPKISIGGNEYYKKDPKTSCKLRDNYDFNFLQPLIFYPTTNKSFDRLSFGQLKIVWDKIYESILESDVVYACGFSFRDKHFNEIIKNISNIRDSRIEFRIIDYNEKIIEFLESEFKGFEIDFIYETKTLKEFIEKTTGHNIL